MSQNEESELSHLKGCELAGLVFIRDYLQLLFDGPVMNVYLWPIVRIDGKVFAIDNQGYRDALCEQIGKMVVDTIEESKQRLLLRFEDNSEVEISLKDDDQNGPEVASLILEDQNWVVW